MTHRALHCPIYESVRQRFPAEVRLWPQRSAAFTHHGLHPANPHQWAYWKALLALPDRREEFLDLQVLAEHTFIFTDGSCSMPRKPTCALAAWAVTTMEPKRTLAQGPVPGLVQSIDVAEAMAVHSAFLWVLRTGAKATIFSDSQYAVDNFKYLQKHREVPPRWKHQSLWFQALHTVEQIDMNQVIVQKISSHVADEECFSPRADWCKRGNDFADTLARWQNSLRSPAFSQVHALFCDEEERATAATRGQLNFLLHLARVSLSTTPECAEAEDAPVGSLGSGLEMNDASLAAQFGPHASSLGIRLCRFSSSLVGDLISWLVAVDITSSFKGPVSLLELMVGFCLDGHQIPLFVHHDGGDNLLLQEVPCSGLVRSTVATELCVFTDLFKTIQGHFNLSVDFCQMARPHLRIFRRMSCIRMGWSGSIAARVNEDLSRFTSSWPIRFARDLARPR